MMYGTVRKMQVEGLSLIRIDWRSYHKIAGIQTNGLGGN